MFSSNQKWVAKQLTPCYLCTNNNGRKHTINITWNDFSFGDNVYSLCYWCHKTIINNYVLQNYKNVIKLVGKYRPPMYHDVNNFIAVLLENKKIIDEQICWRIFYPPTQEFSTVRQKIIDAQISNDNSCKKLNIIKFSLMFKCLPVDIINIIISTMKLIINQ